MQQLITFLGDMINTVPLSLYVTLGGLIEEVIAPIPSPLIMTSAGTLALQKGHTAFYIVIISALAAIGKTIGSIFIYVLTDKAEDLVLVKYGKFFGVSHKEVEKIGKRLNGTWTDDIILVLLRAIPVIPGAPVAAVCGLIKVNMRTYIQSTFIGVWIRSMIFGFTGFYGLSKVNEFISNTESLVDITLILGVVSFGVIYIYRKKDHFEKLVHDALDKKI